MQYDTLMKNVNVQGQLVHAALRAPPPHTQCLLTNVKYSICTKAEDHTHVQNMHVTALQVSNEEMKASAHKWLPRKHGTAMLDSHGSIQRQTRTRWLAYMLAGQQKDNSRQNSRC